MSYKTIFSTLLAIVVFINAEAQWKESFDKLKGPIIAACFISAKTGFVLNNTTLQFTIDSGQHWNTQATPSEHYLFDICFINDSSGWIAGGNFPNGIIYHSTNGGITWTANKTQLCQILKMSFINEKEGWAVGNKNLYTAIYHTTDAGQTWEIQYEGNDYLRTILFIDNKIGWAAGDNGQRLYTKDGGKNWQILTRADIIHYKTLTASSSNLLWVAGSYQYGALNHSCNGGKNFTPQKTNNPNPINRIAALNEKEIWLAANNGTLLYSPNGGKKWLQSPLKSNEDIMYIRFFNTGYGIAVGARGGFYQFYY